MTAKARITFDERPEIVAKIDAIAAREGSSRADVIRRTLRHFVFFVPECSSKENTSLSNQSTANTTTN